ncbi:MAG: hypothetical protein WCV84_02105 [Patescibacteria group bacterium]
MPIHKHKNAWIVSVNMGYGHERAAFGLEDLAYGDIITANHYPGIPEKDKRMWQSTRRIYEFISRLQPIPVIGALAFGALDYFQRIPPFYPRRDLSKPTLQLIEMYRMIERGGLGKHLIEKLSRINQRPFISTFFLPAFAAEVHGYPGDIFCVCCDADISRAWVPLDPKRSRIKYFAPNGRVVERLKLYGVREENIFLTGFPLPKSSIGGPEGRYIKKDLSDRLLTLDPQRIFIEKYHETLRESLDRDLRKLQAPHRPISVTFSVGGAGAQKMLGVEIMQGLRKQLLKKTITLNLEAGTRRPVAHFFTSHAKALGLESLLNKNLHIRWYETRPEYFRGFARSLRTTDVLWTKPSELSFYTGLGLPIVMAPPIGSQEEFNKIWLQSVGGGVPQLDPYYVGEWLMDWVNSGGLARYAWNGYIEAPTHGTYRIESIMTGEEVPLAALPLIV